MTLSELERLAREGDAHDMPSTIVPNATILALIERCRAMERVCEALDSLRTVIATSSRDWSSTPGDAWIWGVVLGWDEPALAEVAAQHGWDEAACARLRRMSQDLDALLALDAHGKEGA